VAYPYVRVVTASPGALRQGTAPYDFEVASAERNFSVGLSLLDGAGAQGADLALLPELFITAGLERSESMKHVQSIDGSYVSAIAEKARRHKMNVVAGLLIMEGNTITNRAVLFDRQGDIIGSYGKRFPTEKELNFGVSPDNGPIVFDTDIGRLALPICFDINWPGLWQEMTAAGAELICWLSAYGGGFPLQALAWTTGRPVVTSVRPAHSVMIERTGFVSGRTARGNPLGVFDINLDQRMFHTDFHMEKILPMIERHGANIKVVSHTEEHVFTLESTSPDLKIQDVIDEFELVEFNDYIARCSTQIENARLDPRT
jgi:predicted amidohydrolase